MASPSESLLAEVKYDGKVMATLNVANILARLDPAIPLTTTEAAIFTRMSVSTLERLRKSGDGPVYYQGGSKGSNGTNQPCMYFKDDLAAYQRSNKVSSSMMAAIRKGQTFATIHDLARKEAFYVDDHGEVESMVEGNLLGTVVGRIGKWNVIWMDAVEAASRRWTDFSKHKEFAQGVQSVLLSADQSIFAALEATEISEAVPYAISKSIGVQD